MLASPLIRATLTTSVMMVAAFGSLSAAHAAPLDDTEKRVPVTFATADLATPEKTEKVYAGLRQAAQQACDSEQPGPLWRLADDKACEDDAVRGALKALNNPLLDRLYAQTSDAPELAAVLTPAATDR